MRTGQSYEEAYAAWRRDPEGFWAEAARGIHWDTPPARAFDPSLGVYGRWFVDGVARPAWDGLAKVTLATQTLTKGKHVLRLVARDPTDKVRRDDLGLLEDAVSWELTIR